MNNSKIQQLLDSDDELPLSYNEDPITPAYENDHRFNDIVFKWINNNGNNLISTKLNKEENNITNNKNIRRYVSKGYLSAQDLFCLKSISETISDQTLLWFADFLVWKDLYSRYGSNLKSCLVAKYPCDNLNIKKETISEKFSKKYKIVVKI